MTPPPAAFSAGLVARGIPSEEIIIVPNSFPKILPESFQTSDFTSAAFYRQLRSPAFQHQLRTRQFWNDVESVPHNLNTALERFESLSNPNAPFSQQAYDRMKTCLAQHGVTSPG